MRAPRPASDGTLELCLAGTLSLMTAPRAAMRSRGQTGRAGLSSSVAPFVTSSGKSRFKLSVWKPPACFRRKPKTCRPPLLDRRRDKAKGPVLESTGPRRESPSLQPLCSLRPHRRRCRWTGYLVPRTIRPCAFPRKQQSLRAWTWTNQMVLYAPCAVPEQPLGIPP